MGWPRLHAGCRRRVRLLLTHTVDLHVDCHAGWLAFGTRTGDASRRGTGKRRSISEPRGRREFEATDKPDLVEGQLLSDVMRIMTFLADIVDIVPLGIFGGSARLRTNPGRTSATVDCHRAIHSWSQEDRRSVGERNAVQLLAFGRQPSKHHDICSAQGVTGAAAAVLSSLSIGIGG